MAPCISSGAADGSATRNRAGESGTFSVDRWTPPNSQAISRTLAGMSTVPLTT
jgi:hypothetical protein